MSPKTLPPENPILEWNAPQHAHVERGKVWYAVAAIAVVLMTIYSIWTQAWTFTFLIVLLGVMYWRTHKDAPAPKRFRVWKQGFALEDSFEEWKNCKGFWILKIDGYSELHIEKNNGRDVKIQTGELSPYAVEETLSTLVAELNDRKEDILDTIIRICKL